jgi:hypothetical protein
VVQYRVEEAMTFISTVVISTMFCVALERIEEMFCVTSIEYSRLRLVQ